MVIITPLSINMEYRDAECRKAERHISITMRGVVLLNAVMLSVVTLSAVAPLKLLDICGSAD
jgi:hypothetical protein